MPTNNRIVGLVQKKVLLAVSKLHYIILNSVVLGIEHKLFELVDLQYRDMLWLSALVGIAIESCDPKCEMLL